MLFRSENHDWASLVAYEAFPADLADQLDEVGYWQARRAHDLALQRLEAAANATPEEDWQARAADVQAMAQRLPNRGPFALECAGLLARCVQHEHDHCQGILFIDRMTRAHQLLTATKVKKLQRETKAELKAARKQA